MDQMRFGRDPLPKKTRKEVFLDEMNQVVPSAALVELVRHHARGAHQALGGRPPFPIETMLRIHCLQLWWNLSDPAMEEEPHERPLYRRFVGLEGAARMAATMAAGCICARGYTIDITGLSKERTYSVFQYSIP